MKIGINAPGTQSWQTDHIHKNLIINAREYDGALLVAEGRSEYLPSPELMVDGVRTRAPNEGSMVVPLGTTRVVFEHDDTDLKHTNRYYRDSVAGMGVLRNLDYHKINNTKAFGLHLYPDTDNDKPLNEGTGSWLKYFYLCRELGMTPYICLPHNVSTILLEYVVDLFKEISGTRYELSNEVWNGQFTQYKYFRDLNQVAGAGEGDFGSMMKSYHAETVRVAAVIKERDPDAIFVFGGWADNEWSTSEYVKMGFDHVDEFAIAPYFNGVTNNADWSTLSLNEMFENAEYDIRVNWPDKLALHTSHLPEHVKLIAYECGSHASPLDEEQKQHSDFLDRLRDFHNDPRQRGLHHQYCTMLSQYMTLALFYNNAIKNTKHGMWGLSENINDLGHPRRAGVIDFMAGVTTPDVPVEPDVGNNDDWTDPDPVDPDPIGPIDIPDINDDGVGDNADLEPLRSIFFKALGNQQYYLALIAFDKDFA